MKPAERGKKDALENLKREIAILKKVDHPNIVKLYEVCMIINIIFFSLLDSDWLKTVPINP